MLSARCIAAPSTKQAAHAIANHRYRPARLFDGVVDDRHQAADDVIVEGKSVFRLVRLAPVDQPRAKAFACQMAHQAAPSRQIEDVAAIDQRRNDDNRLQVGALRCEVKDARGPLRPDRGRVRQVSPIGVMAVAIYAVEKQLEAVSSRGRDRLGQLAGGHVAHLPGQRDGLGRQAWMPGHGPAAHDRQCRYRACLHRHGKRQVIGQRSRSDAGGARGHLAQHPPGWCDLFGRLCLPGAGCRLARHRTRPIPLPASFRRVWYRRTWCRQTWYRQTWYRRALRRRRSGSASR